MMNELIERIKESNNRIIKIDKENNLIRIEIRNKRKSIIRNYLYIEKIDDIYKFRKDNFYKIFNNENELLEYIRNI